MKKVTASYTCDICNKVISHSCQSIGYSHTVGFAPIEAFGVHVLAKPFGSYREDICKECGEKAIIAIANAIANRAKAVSAKAEKEEAAKRGQTN